MQFGLAKRLLSAAALCAALSAPALGAEETAAAMASRIQSLAPEIDAYVESGRKAFDSPGVALGVVVGDQLVYAKQGFRKVVAGFRTKTLRKQENLSKDSLAGQRILA